MGDQGFPYIVRIIPFVTIEVVWVFDDMLEAEYPHLATLSLAEDLN